MKGCLATALHYIHFFYFSFTLACAAASLAMGTLNGEQET